MQNIMLFEIYEYFGIDMNTVKKLSCLFLLLGSELTRGWPLDPSNEDTMIIKIPDKRTLKHFRKTTTVRRKDTTTPLTTTDVTEKPFAETTTTGSSTTTDTLSQLPCPYGENRYVKDDLREIIASRTANAVELITGSYNETAIALRNKHTKSLETFLEWFKGRPLHLKHILEDLLIARKNIQTGIENINESFVKYPVLEKQLQQLMQRINNLQKEFDKTKIMCADFCQIEDKERLMQFQKPLYEEYYCARDKDLNTKIAESTNEFIQNIVNEYKQKIEEDDKQYVEKVDALKSHLKDIALKEFGYTMYDILNLLDEYHHLDQQVAENKIRPAIQKAERALSDLNAKLYYLEQNAENLRTKCRSCYPRQILYLSAADHNLKELAKDLLQELLIQKQNADKKEIEEQYLNFFEHLNEQLDINNADIFVENLKPIGKEVIEMTSEEYEKYRELKEAFPQSSIDSVKSITMSIDQIVQRVQNIENELQEYDRNTPSK